MREFKRKLSVIMVIAMILALIPGAGAREITARAAEKVEGFEHLDVWNLGWDNVFYRGTKWGVTYKAEFATASNADRFIDTANENPDDVIEIKILDKSGKPAEGIEIVWNGAWPARDWSEEEGPNSVIFQYVADVKDEAPDSVVVQIKVGDDDSRSDDVEIKDIPVSEKELTVSGRKSVEVGKTIRLAVTADSEDAVQFLTIQSDDDKKAQETGDWENKKDWKTDWFRREQSGATQYIEILGLNEGTSTYEFYIEGSEEETKTTVEITVKPRTMTLSESEIELSATEVEHTVDIRDIAIDDIFGYKGLEREDRVDDWLLLYNHGEDYRPVFTISDETVARLVEVERYDETDTRWFASRRIEPLKEGTATITVEWLGAKAEAVLTVTGAPLQDEINKIIQNYRDSHGLVDGDQPIPAADLNSDIIPEISKTVKGKALNDRAWDSLGWLNSYCSLYVNDWWGLAHESVNTVGLYERVEYFAASMTIPDEGRNDDHFWVTMDDAREADVNAVSGTGKIGFNISFGEGTDRDHIEPITELKVPVRVTLAIPEDLADVAEKDLVVYYVGGTAARSASGTVKELSSGYVVKKGDSLLLQIDQPGTYILAKRISNTSSSSGGYSYSSGSSSKVTNSYIPGWVQNETGWWYRYSNGTWPANTWAELVYNGRTDWYHFDANGYMQTGWFTDTDGRVYYLNPVSDGWMGSMFVGSHVIDGKTYYFNEVDDGHKGALVQ